MIATTALLLALCSAASGLVIPARKTKLTGGELTTQACHNVPMGLTVCHPYAQHKYIKCGETSREHSCSNENVYDYGTRSCASASMAKPCPLMNCPAGSWSPFQGGIVLGPQASSSGNLSVTYNEPGTYYYFCPVFTHCQMGQYLKVVVEEQSPAGYMSTINTVKWAVPTTNDQRSYTNLDSIIMFTGDTLYLAWTDFHSWGTYDKDHPTAPQVVPYLPQPLYSCPVWSNVTSSNSTTVVYATVPGETRLMDVQLLRGEYNLTVTVDMDGSFIADHYFSFCRTGMIFKLNVTAGQGGMVYPIDWVMSTFQNFPDMDVVVGDSLSFRWEKGVNPGAPQSHGLTMLAPSAVQTYFQV